MINSFLSIEETTNFGLLPPKKFIKTIAKYLNANGGKREQGLKRASKPYSRNNSNKHCYNSAKVGQNSFENYKSTNKAFRSKKAVQTNSELKESNNINLHHETVYFKSQKTKNKKRGVTSRRYVNPKINSKVQNISSNQICKRSVISNSDNYNLNINILVNTTTGLDISDKNKVDKNKNKIITKSSDLLQRKEKKTTRTPLNLENPYSSFLSISNSNDKVVNVNLRPISASPSSKSETQTKLLFDQGVNILKSKIPSNKMLMNQGILNRSHRCVYQNQATTIKRPTSARSINSQINSSQSFTNTLKTHQNEEKESKQIYTTPRDHSCSALINRNDKKKYISEKKGKKELKRNILKLLQVVRPISSKVRY